MHKKAPYEFLARNLDFLPTAFVLIVLSSVDNTVSLNAFDTMITDSDKTIDCYLMLGVGEEHGANAVQWLLNHIYASTVGINSFVEKKKVLLHRKSGKRIQTLTRIDLADWHIINTHYQEAKCRSWFAYDVNWITIGLSYFWKQSN